VRELFNQSQSCDRICDRNSNSGMGDKCRRWKAKRCSGCVDAVSSAAKLYPFVVRSLFVFAECWVAGLVRLGFLGLSAPGSPH
jgi:hypothetical protein